ncbi:potassium channel protein [Nitriliruptoraceae bacterium ZYF776]|nr:potassium channel protein [Profundirhabdus halotolerans]
MVGRRVKSLGLLLATISAPLRRWNVRFAIWMVVGFVALVVVYSAIFHGLMAAEGRSFSWTTSVYWTLTVMSTLGFGDITFASDAGRIFSMLVLISGASVILVLLPFVFIQFIFTPWMQARESARAPRQVDEGVAGHIVLTQLDPISDAIIDHARHAEVPYVLIVADLEEALRLHDRGYRVLVGDPDDPSTYEAARVDEAALVATTRSDTANTNIAFTVREIDEEVPIAALASEEASVDILELAGVDRVVQLGELLGQALARRVVGVDARVHPIGQFGELRIAEASVNGTELEDRTIRDADLRARTGVNVIGVWQRGEFEHARPDTCLSARSVLILAGSDEQLANYDELIGVDRQLERPVLILGGGRVGRAAARAFEEQGVAATIVEKRTDRLRSTGRYVHGDAAAREVLEEAGLDDAAAALVTTHEDDVNVYLTLYLRRLRPDLQVIARATRDRNVSTLHRAGADAVLSYASLGATAMWNAMGHTHRLLVAEGLEIFRVPVPEVLRGRPLSECEIGERTGVQVVAIAQHGHLEPLPAPSRPLPTAGDLVLIGDDEAEGRFVDEYGAATRKRRR